MLSYNLLFLLLAISSTSSVKKATGLGKKPAAARDCTRLKCPLVDEPVCARLVRRPGDAGAVYVVMVNKCEMNYVKCHKGLEGAVVPMKNCQHDNFLKTKGNKRSKRDAEENISKPVSAEIVLAQGEPPPSEEAVDAPSVRDVPENSGSEYAPDNLPPPRLGDMDAERYSDIDDWDGDGFPDPTAQPDEEDADYPKIVQPSENLREDEGGIQEDQVEDIGEYSQGGIGADPGGLDYQQEQGNNSPGGIGADPDGLDYQQEQDSNWPMNDVDYEKAMLQSARAPLSNYTDPYFNNVNKQQYNADCPTVCPLRNVMVCARCQHGVYRTFLTICHLRMFVCQHTEETLSLMSREACVLSAPFLSDPGSAPQGRLGEPTDEDRVLRYLRCSQLSQASREVDPRCYWLVNLEIAKQQLMMPIRDDY